MPRNVLNGFFPSFCRCTRHLRGVHVQQRLVRHTEYYYYYKYFSVSTCASAPVAWLNIIYFSNRIIHPIVGNGTCVRIEYFYTRGHTNAPHSPPAFTRNYHNLKSSCYSSYGGSILYGFRAQQTVRLFSNCLRIFPVHFSAIKRFGL